MWKKTDRCRSPSWYKWISSCHGWVFISRQWFALRVARQNPSSGHFTVLHGNGQNRSFFYSWERRPPAPPILFSFFARSHAMWSMHIYALSMPAWIYYSGVCSSPIHLLRPAAPWLEHSTPLAPIKWDIIVHDDIMTQPNCAIENENITSERSTVISGWHIASIRY